MGLEIVQGRNFKKEMSNDLMYGYILNEAAVTKLGLDDPIDTDFGRAPKVHGYTGIKKLGKVIGVVKDFHFNTLHNKIESMAMFIHPQKLYPYKYFLIKVKTADLTNTISDLKRGWANISPDRPFEFTFLDNYFQKLYTTDQKLETIFRYFVLLAILEACLGLYGMISFTTEQRVKEVGIRKTLGAGIQNIVGELLKNTIQLIIIANIIAWPMAYLFTNKWLDRFAYRIDIQISIFFISAIIVFLITALTVGMKTFKAANLNPVESLRYE